MARNQYDLDRNLFLSQPDAYARPKSGKSATTGSGFVPAQTMPWPIDVPSMGEIQEQMDIGEERYPGASGSTSQIPDAIPPFPGADEEEWSGFRNWLGQEAPGGAFDPQFVDPSFDPSQQGTLGYHDTGPMAERWAPWDAPSGPGKLWNWPTSDAPKYAGQVQSGWDLSSMRGGTGPYLKRSPEEEARITTVRRALGEYRDAPFADKAETLEDWRQKYHGDVQAYGQAQEAERSAALGCMAAGGTPVIEGGRFIRCDMPQVTTTPPPPQVTTTPPPPQVTTTRRKGYLPPTDSELPDTRLLTDQAPVIDPTGRIPPEKDVVPFMETELEDPLVVETGVDPLSQLTNLRLGQLMHTGGVVPTRLAAETEETLEDILRRRGAGASEMSPFGEDIQSTIEELLASGGAIPADAQRRAMELETARSPLDALREAQLEEGRAALASRNLLGSGPELEYMQRVEQGLAPRYAQAAQEIELAERAAADQRYRDAMQMGTTIAAQAEALEEGRLSSAMSLATGMSEEQSRNLLATAQTITQRQQMLSDIALETLDKNMEWNKFLAEFGLERDMALEMIQSGRLGQLLPLIQQFLNIASLTARGYVPSTSEADVTS
jgi:hypothetical protein|tara:strand:+ start:1130 stop:2950 length:1821 start_codon:yes stop_codon:yes gene_type:complete